MALLDTKVAQSDAAATGILGNPFNHAPYLVNLDFKPRRDGITTVPRRRPEPGGVTTPTPLRACSKSSEQGRDKAKTSVAAPAATPPWQASTPAKSTPPGRCAATIWA
ncbi:hypothetical protein JOS77_12625 [Chromobacterium haemolyticum]|nr:hypothetical protein JOS77_12625 [Chromobacterium haemolyticum]